MGSKRPRSKAGVKSSAAESIKIDSLFRPISSKESYAKTNFRALSPNPVRKCHFCLTCGMSINENQPVVRLKSFLIACLWAIPATAGEGLWPYNQFPKDSVKQKLGFEVEPAFLDHLRLASVMLPGGSGSFVSPAGLLLTTRALAADCLSGLSTPQHDYFRDGFQAAAKRRNCLAPAWTPASS